MTYTLLARCPRTGALGVGIATYTLAELCPGERPARQLDHLSAELEGVGWSLNTIVPASMKSGQLQPEYTGHALSPKC
jgi:hypothetical protein